MSVTAPSPRPAQGFSTERAQKWVLVSALLTAVIYGFRRTIEPAQTSSTPAKNKLAALAGSGSPPALGQWLVSYAVAFGFLAVIALGAPEFAASLAGVVVLGNLLNNGTTIVADLAGIGGGAKGSLAAPTGTSGTAPGLPSATQVNQATGATAAPAPAPTTGHGGFF